MKNFKPQLKRITFLIILFFSVIISAQVGINTTTPEGALDVASTTQGFVPPRVALTSTIVETVVNPRVGSTGLVAGTVVWNTATDGTIPNNVVPGLYVWEGAKWILINFSDGDFFEVGTTTPPNNITDDVFRTGKVSIGRDATNSKLDVYDTTSGNAVEFEIRGSQEGSVSGLFVDYSKTITNSGSHYAFRSYLRSGSGDGPRYGMFNNIQSDANSSSLLYGVRNNVSTSNTVGTYRIYGQYNQVNDAVTGTHQLVGTYNNIGSGTGEHVGNYNSMSGEQNGKKIGTVNYFNNSSDGEHIGVANTLTSTGSGDRIGVYNNINKSIGNNWGFRNEIDSTAVGMISYGTYNNLTGSDVGGTAIAGYFSSTGAGTNYAAIFENGNVGIGTAAPTEELHVIGNILASGSITPDYVFENYYNGSSNLNPNYKMLSLEEIEHYTKLNNHLPGVPSALEIKKQGGILVNRATEINLEKVEELFLHSIEANKKIKTLEKENNALESKLDKALKAIELLNNRLENLEKK